MITQVTGLYCTGGSEVSWVEVQGKFLTGVVTQRDLVAIVINGSEGWRFVAIVEVCHDV